MAAASLTAAGAAPALASAQFAPGADGLGDPFFPHAGNGGYEVAHYDLRLDYRPDGARLEARARIDANATQDLSAFDLDYRGPRIRSVRVDGRRAAYGRTGQELVITPDAGLPAGSRFEVVVRYSGRPRQIVDPDGGIEGWVRTDDGAFVVGEPQGSPTWFPCNDYPTDKATYAFRITVPRRLEAIANGSLIERRRRGRTSVWRWRERSPMASYLATATIGQFRLERSRFGGLESVVAVDPRERKASRGPLSKIPAMTRLFESLFGPYPFDETGAIVDHAPKVGYALETQTRPIYDRAPGQPTVAHELAHQWFGDSVSVASWPEIWLNEGFATWAEWRWAEHRGGRSTARAFRHMLAVPADQDRYWDPPPGAVPDPSKLFADSVYVRGAMALEALRQRIGDDAFYATMRDWTQGHAYGNASIEQFTALAEARSGQDLDSLFATWLDQPGKPAV
ncbi:MAG: M1 family peptidase [Solirubrobacterales bacterium]|nr:M1 family peptidase [Solirubrobacterales bacterium]